MIDTIKHRILKFLKRSGYHLHGRGYLADNLFDYMLYELLNQRGHLSFVQIGAHDGVHCDPLHEFIKANHRQVDGIVVEPLKDYFDELCVNYRRFPNIKPVNLAIHTSEKSRHIYRVDPRSLENYPEWAKGSSSFSKEKLIQSDKIKPESIISESVRCVSLNELVSEYQLESMDLLQIDTEGYDFDIVSNIDFNSISPGIIHFEHGLPKDIMSREKLDVLRDLLHKNGYALWVGEWDAVAYRTDFLQLTKP